MKINNIEGLTGDQIRNMVSHGGKFVIYKYCISIILMTFNRASDIYFIRPEESRITPGLGYFVLNFVAGWWGIPWGPIYTIGNIFSTLSGGKDVTAEVMAEINQRDTSYGTGTTYNVPNANAAGGGNTYNIPSN